ncbi:hypothetical protein MHYP_G00311440 [Metynnis hypsauchen]
MGGHVTSDFPVTSESIMDSITQESTGDHVTVLLQETHTEWRGTSDGDGKQGSANGNEFTEESATGSRATWTE